MTKTKFETELNEDLEYFRQKYEKENPVKQIDTNCLFNHILKEEYGRKQNNKSIC